MGRINFENSRLASTKSRDRPHPRYYRTKRPQRLEIIRRLKQQFTPILNYRQSARLRSSRLETTKYRFANTFLKNRILISNFTRICDAFYGKQNKTTKDREFSKNRREILRILEDSQQFHNFTIRQFFDSNHAKSIATIDLFHCIYSFRVKGETSIAKWRISHRSIGQFSAQRCNELYYGRSNELAKSEIPKGIPCTPRDRPVSFSNPRVANWPGRCFLLHATKYYQQFPSNQRGSRTWRRRVALERATSPLVHRGNHEAGMERRMNGGWGRRGTRGKRNNERDAYVSFLIVTGSTLRYRPREARPCHYYPIISCITVTVNEVSYYAARRGGG